MEKRDGPRIGLVGSAGTGKSMLGQTLCKRSSIPFMAAKEITVDILHRDGYDYSAHIQVERFLAHAHRQHEILERTRVAHQGTEFVTDRTFIDLAAYALCEMHDSDPREMSRVMEECRTGLVVYTHLFFCPWAGVDLRRSNSRRTLNPYYQLLIHNIEIGFMNDWGVGYHVFPSPNLEERVAYIINLLMEQGYGIEMKSVVLNEGEEQE